MGRRGISTIVNRQVGRALGLELERRAGDHYRETERMNWISNPVQQPRRLGTSLPASALTPAVWQPAEMRNPRQIAVVEELVEQLEREEYRLPPRPVGITVCRSGRHRSSFLAQEIQRSLAAAGSNERPVPRHWEQCYYCMAPRPELGACNMCQGRPCTLYCRVNGRCPEHWDLADRELD